MTSCPKTKSIQ